MTSYQICTRCVMDTTDPEITFDEQGVCNHCRSYDESVRRHVFSGDEGKRQVMAIAERMKKDGRGRDYDCVIGVSGGVDSTFTAWWVKELGLRPLAVHLDNGWDSEMAVSNIYNTLNTLNIDLHTHVIDWEEFRDLQLSFLKASTPDSEIPSDHAIAALMYETARRLGVKYVIAGCNIRTESHLPAAWSQGHWDWKYIKNLQKQFGTTELNTYPHMNLLSYFRNRATIKWINILNYLDYVKKDAMQVIEQKLGWKYYGGKHYESIYTRFYQGYILPQKFGFDKRKTHLSSLICSGEITREKALEELQEETYPIDLQEADKDYVVKKFGLSTEEFDAIMNRPRKTYWDYPSAGRLYRRIVIARNKIRAFSDAAAVLSVGQEKEQKHLVTGK